jgi:hypothetical protein
MKNSEIQSAVLKIAARAAIGDAAAPTSIVMNSRRLIRAPKGLPRQTSTVPSGRLRDIMSALARGEGRLASDEGEG